MRLRLPGPLLTMVLTRTSPYFAAPASKLVARAAPASSSAGAAPSPKKRAGSGSSSAPAPSPSPKKRARSPKKEAPALEPPAGWRSTYDLITELRADRTAVVDSMGSEAIATSAGSAEERNYQVLISLMLSSQTKDTVNAATMAKLRAHGLTMANILATPDDELDELIRAVGFHNNKVKFIKATTRLLVDEHDSTVPDTLEALTALPGVGPKMALICLNVCFDKIVGISVDTHVHRISNQLGWTGGGAPTKNPEATRAALESWMPFEVWGEVNLLLVGLGQEVQTEKPKLLRKALACSDPPAALRLLEVCGVDVAKEGAKHGIDVPA